MTPHPYRPTTLKIASRHCSRAIDFYEDDAPVNRRIYATGTAAHAMIQAAIEAAAKLGRVLTEDEFDAVTLKVAEGMIRDGRTFEGSPEPPLPADDVWRGRDLARSFADRYPIEPGTLAHEAEVGMAVDEDWQPVKYGPGARLRLIADFLTVLEEVDEEQATRVLVVRDYKSAWSTDASELDTLQLKAQAVLAGIFHGADVDGIRQEVVNLRTGATYSRELWYDEGGTDTLAKWREELETTMRALDDGRNAEGLHKASPGGGCVGCPYVERCDAAQDWIDAFHVHKTPTARAEAYVALLATVANLRDTIKAETDEEPIPIAGGKLVGSVATDVRRPDANAWRTVLDAWVSQGGEVGGLLKAARLGIKQLEGLARALYPDRDQKAEREEWLGKLFTVGQQARFGVHDLPGEEK